MRECDTFTALAADSHGLHTRFKGVALMSAVFSQDPIEISSEIEAVLNYTRNTGVRPVNYTFEPPPGVPRNSALAFAHTRPRPKRSILFTAVTAEEQGLLGSRSYSE